MRESMSWEDKVRKAVPYVAGEQPKNKKVIKLNTNECPYPPAPGVEEALRHLDVDALRRYPALNAGALRDALAERYHVEPEQVFVGVGSDDVLAMSFMTFFQSGKPVLFPDITYSFYDVWADLYGIAYERQPLTESFELRKEDYKKENGGVLIANPNAPTGIAAPLSVIEEILEANRDVVVIIDEAYIDFGGESALPLIEKYDNLLVVQTFSKSRSMAGMRIGFAIGSKKLIGFLDNVKFSFNSYTMSAAAIATGVASVKDEAYFQSTVARIIATREWTKKELAKLGFACTDSKTNFVFAAHESIPAEEIFEALRKNDIFVRYWKKPRIENYLRISIGTEEEMQQVIAFLTNYIQERKEKGIV